MQETKERQTKINNKGITLVALVITIIVLLILAGIGIGAIAGPEGLIAKARQAAEDYEQAAREEANAINEIFEMANGGTEGGDEEPEQPVIDAEGNVQFKYTPSTPTRGNVTVEITTGSGYQIQYRTGTSGNFSRYNGAFTVEENTVINVKLANSSGITGGVATGNVQNIDKIAPNAFTPTIGEITANSIVVNASTIDTGSVGCAAINTGIKEYKYYVGGELKYTGTEESVTITGLTEGTEYSIYVIAEDKAGNTTTSTAVTAETTRAYISTTESYVGYYANLDGDEEPEGIIYADLLIGGSGQWGGADGTYTINTIENAKEYKISTEKYNGAFGEKEVITASGEGSERSERFHVMALENIDSSTHYWYYNADGNMNDYATATSVEFGAGRANTQAMIAKWNSSGYGAQNGNDMWGLIQEEVAQGWFVPSRGEWAAFADAFDITSSNYDYKFGLSNYYWSSSQSNTGIAWRANFYFGHMDGTNVNRNYSVRLATTF